MNRILAACVGIVVLVATACGSGSGGVDKSGVVASCDADQTDPGPETAHLV